MANQPNPSSLSGRASTGVNRMQPLGWLLLGLLAGLLIGWVVWPVEWVDADIDDLGADVRAQFISATADAYVASGGQDPSTALARMQHFADPQTAVVEAIEFYRSSNDPKRAIREVNLRSLAAALSAESTAASTLSTSAGPGDEGELGWWNWILGALTALILITGGLWIGRRLLADWRNRPALTSPAPAGQIAGIPPTPPTANRPQSTVSPQTAGSPQESTAGGWQPSPPPDQTTTSAPAHSVRMETWDRMDEAPDFVQRVVPPNVSTTPSQADDYEDEGEIDTSTDVDTETIDGLDVDVAVTPAFRRILPEHIDTSVDRPSEIDGGSESQAFDFADMGGFVDYANLPADEEIDELLDEDDAWPAGPDDIDLEDGSEQGIVPKNSTSDVAETNSGSRLDPWINDMEEMRSIPPVDESESEPHGEIESSDDDETIADWSRIAGITDGESEEEEDSGILPTVKGVLSGWRRNEREASNQDKGELGRFTAEYNLGIPSYAQSFTIVAPPEQEGEDGVPLGACGMGIDEAVDKSAANSNKVHVLDVWLYDGTSVRSESQYLVSPGVDKRSLSDQTPSAGTVTGEPLDIAPDLSFSIPSKSLVLECRILNVEFLTPGVQPSPLRTVQVDMKVRRRGE